VPAAVKLRELDPSTPVAFSIMTKQLFAQLDDLATEQLKVFAT
jgi:hypothetical protein